MASCQKGVVTVRVSEGIRRTDGGVHTSLPTLSWKRLTDWGEQSPGGRRTPEADSSAQPPANPDIAFWALAGTATQHAMLHATMGASRLFLMGAISSP